MFFISLFVFSYVFILVSILAYDSLSRWVRASVPLTDEWHYLHILVITFWCSFKKYWSSYSLFNQCWLFPPAVAIWAESWLHQHNLTNLGIKRLYMKSPWWCVGVWPWFQSVASVLLGTSTKEILNAPSASLTWHKQHNSAAKFACQFYWQFGLRIYNISADVAIRFGWPARNC